ncbi:MarR family winged helix-turn-helix transcriptional regulator [Subtercola endophyticus]|uniref:MarR family winged helix-turn-helix transcriptional regulator n=1 Tax=Subtercola endophyticus TaxID=2895559 RepID=UPI001E3E6B9A|nr:MarR family transcriptional regulator [Subtercola endophyticus]UFS59530.1 MarR family transcriptional regulator [Subtercola endophyticus]
MASRGSAPQHVAPLLDEQICFALYNASRAMTARYRELLEPLGLTYPQYLVMLVLWESEPVTVSHLGARLQLDSGTLSPLLRRLETAGLVTRNRSVNDERSVLVSLTPAGDELRAQTTRFPELVCGASGLSVEAIGALRDQVFAFADNVRSSV